MGQRKIILIPIFLLLFYSTNLYGQNNRNSGNFYRDKIAEIVYEGEFTAKVIESCDRPKNYGADTISYFIGLKTPELPVDTSAFFNLKSITYIGCSYYWNAIFDKYTNDEKIKILEELLEYEKDTDLSGTKVMRYGFVKPDISRPKTISYTMQTEALFIITLLTMSETSLAYCPYPVLVNIKTNKEINNNQKEIKKVFKIYKKWVDENKKNGFVNFTPPLEGTNYKWYGGIDYGADFRMDNLHFPGMIVGEGKHTNYKDELQD